MRRGATLRPLGPGDDQGREVVPRRDLREHEAGYSWGGVARQLDSDDLRDPWDAFFCANTWEWARVFRDGTKVAYGTRRRIYRHSESGRVHLLL